MKINLENLRSLVEQRYLACRPHPSGDLLIWNYTAGCQWEKHWTPETMMCRGLVTDKVGNVLARPFPKFFNLDEHQGELPVEPFEVTEKMDGSLGILYQHNGEWAIASRGSFDSPQALRGTEILHRQLGHVGFDPDYTYLFEILYPENRIVVDYGDREELVFLTSIHTETGMENSNLGALTGQPHARRYDGIKDFSELAAHAEKGQEGFVIRFTESNLRLKVKMEEYKRLHKLFTGVTPRRIWELLASGQTLDEMIGVVPDEYYAWVRGIESDLRGQFKVIEDECRAAYREFPTRKETAMYFQTCKNSSVLFCMLDKKDHAKPIWKMLEPEGGRAWRCDNEA